MFEAIQKVRSLSRGEGGLQKANKNGRHIRGHSKSTFVVEGEGGLQKANKNEQEMEGF